MERVMGPRAPKQGRKGMAAKGMAPPGQPLFRFDKKTPQRLVGAAALLVAAYTLFLILWPLRWSLLSTWAVIELVYYVLYWRPRYFELNEQPAKHEPANLEATAMRTFARFLRFCKELPAGNIDYEAYYSGWFRGAPFRDIKRGNAEEFMAYGFWYRTREQLAASGRGHLPGEMVGQLEEAWGIKFEPGFNESIRFMGHLWEPLGASWRPLLFYLCTGFIGWSARQMLRRWGFHHHKHNGLSYFTLNMSKPRAATCTRATSSSTLADAAAAAAFPGAVVPTLPGCSAKREGEQACCVRPPIPRPPSAPNMSVAKRCDSSTSSRSTSPSKGGVARSGGSACNLQRAKSSPFEAGPPDWTPFADPDAPLPPSVSGDFAAAADAAAAAVAAGACSSSGTSSGSSSSGGATSGGSASSSSSHSLSCGARSGSTSTGGASSAAASCGTSRSNPSMPGAVNPSAASSQAGAPLVPGLSMGPSMLLRGTNPLQGALTEGLGSADTPVLFLHGVGGLPAYLEMIMHVVGLGHPVIVVEFRGVSMRLGKVMCADEVAETVIGILDKLGVKEACVVGHSYGTFIAGVLARQYRKRVHTLCLIDPVCFGMFMPHLLYNFLYRVPKWRGVSFTGLFEYLKDCVRLVASRDMHVCATFARRFYWSDLNLWPEDLAPGSVVLLSGKDDLMDAAEVKDMLEVAGHVKVMYNHELTHGAFLLDYEVKQAIVTEMRGLLARSGSAVVGLAKPVLARTLTLVTHGLMGKPSRVSMKRGGGNGRYYVEDHSKQLVRTFTGNLTKMLSQLPGSYRPRFSAEGSGAAGSAFSEPAEVGAGGAATGGAASAVLHKGRAAGGMASSHSVATRLMQTFSGPVRRRFGGGRSWGSGNLDGSSDGSSGQNTPSHAAAAAAGPGGAAAGGPFAAAGAPVGAQKRGKAAAAQAAAHQRTVSRIDEGEVGDEQ